MKYLIAAAAVSMMAMPAVAGDPEKGEKEFRKCKSCHMVVSDSGEEIVKGGKTGPNLYGVVGRTAGTADFKYGDSLVEAGEKGLVWNEENFVAYTEDPRGFLKEYLDDTGAKSKMSFKLRKGAEDVYAYLESVAE
ncbi:cytochrome c [Cribrihabitans marinus]|uniref:Cytochrome c n=1 Tax=Cribrihabitans marinus TaxID=1227549 RepID=A0A1H6Y0D8_9RHOB|nr:cytochrome C [Cribrihabitans marinus]GGH28337.1 cytochrome c2 [Cribrihabitans marinus]SEJ34749.1 cytochrome c [Cribrihabitans marinus]